MGDVPNMSSPSLSTPTEASSPVAVSHSVNRPPSSSTSSNLAPNNHVGNAQDDSITAEDSLRNADPNASPALHHPTENASRVSASTGKVDTDPAKGGHEQQGSNLQTLRELRKQMKDLLVYQQLQQSNQRPSSLCTDPNPNQSTGAHISGVLGPQIATQASRQPGSASHSDSTGSGGTVRLRDPNRTPEGHVGQTPSYPFPKMQSQLTSMSPHGQFKLTLPSEKLKSHMDSSELPGERQLPLMQTPTSNSIFLPPEHKPVLEDPVYPSPNLYDLTLRLNADSGLEAWWSNVVCILQAHYGAERVSLAVPGDATDLENVPWGQKAVFNQHLTDESDDVPPTYLANDESVTGDTSAIGVDLGGKKKDGNAGSNMKGSGSAVPFNRPPLLSRHSFAGFGKDRKPSTLQQPIKTKAQNKPCNNDASDSNECAVNAAKEPSNRDNPTSQPHTIYPLAGSQQNYRQAVFPIARPLEVESDPLIKRTGVVKLFGRTTPVVLTREYSDDAPVPSERDTDDGDQTPGDKVQVTPTAAPQPPQTSVSARPRSRSTLSAVGVQYQMGIPGELYDEYEQIEPSPWAQSPAPSPAPRAHAEQNPFFTSHTVDETAFAKNPPPHDYSKREPLEAIGVDLAKSVVHIPLLHAGRSKQTSTSTLRFPVAIISILSPINPYPSNLRQSLAYLMPHLTTSFCLAQQYSQLERQFASRLETPRYGHLLGLGGTFSDESSELELVAGLSGHVNYALADDGPLSAHASLSSPDERPNSVKLSPSISGLHTPAADLGGLGSGAASNSNGSPGSTVKAPSDAADSYFNVQQSKNVRENTTQHRRRISKVRQNAEFSMPSSPGKAMGKPDGDVPWEDLAQAVGSPQQDLRAQAVRSPPHPLPRHQSASSLYAQLQRELPRPFSDTVAQLMLNSVPLHLFLAKPQSGEVIWTNSKFDAYRRSQPQEQRLRDPWQNIHSSEREHVSQEWANALRTGSQFTERVRVKRFNDESAFRWFIFRANPLISSTGEVLYWIGSFLDIHEQHIAELKAAQEREKFATDAKYRAFSNSIPQVVFEAAEYRGLIFVNEQWHLYTGQKLDEAMNFGFAKHIHPDDLEKCGFLSLKLTQLQNGATASDSSGSPGQISDAQSASPERNLGHGVTPALDELVRRGVVSMQRDENGRVFYSTEIRLRSKGGDFRWHLVRLVRVESSSFGSGENSWYGTCTDINDRKNLERELNKAMQQLNNQMESKTKFFSNMSHEIRTPLNGILGTIPFILDTPLDADQRRMLDTIQNSSTNLRELVDNILDVSRVEAGKMSLVNSWFHVRSVIEDVIDTVASRAIDKGLEMNYLMDVNVPAMVVGDRFRVRQVLINLVGNAVKFTSQGEIHICCSIHHEPSSNLKQSEFLLNFDVVDTGKGFSARDAERLMQRFSQLGQNGSQQHAGSGLGLFLSKQLVEMHGGKLTPSSKEGQGAKFSFYVRVDVPPPPTPEEPRPIHEELQRVTKISPLQKSLVPKEPVDSKGPEVSALPPSLQPPPPDRRASNNLSEHSSVSSAQHTPESRAVDATAKVDQTQPAPSQQDTPSQPTNDELKSQIDHTAHTVVRTTASPMQESQSLRETVSAPSKASPAKDPYTIMILCPLDNARAAIKQHIQQVVPLEVPYSITSVPDVEDWRDMVNDGTCSTLTHLVLNVLNVDDGLEVVQYISEYDPASAPTLVVIVDLYQKRQINPRIKELSASGRRAYTVPKPIKPSAFSAIFDPDNQRDLSKDRNRDMARESNNNFKTMSKMVKEVIGNKGYRILLVEDDETNRMVRCLFPFCL